MRISLLATARRPDAAARTAVPILLVCALAMVAFTMFGPNSSDRTAEVASWVSAVGLVGLAAGYTLLPADLLDRRGAFVLLGMD